MQPSMVIVVLALLTAAGFYFGRRRAIGLAGDGRSLRNLHSLPRYYGQLTALGAAIPALLVCGLWLTFDHVVINHLVIAELPAQMRGESAGHLSLTMTRIQNTAAQGTFGATADPTIQAAADHYRNLQTLSATAMAVVVLAVAGIGGVFGWRAISPALRARNFVERIIMGLLVACSLVAIFTTVGILLSVLFEAIRFFHAVSPLEFLFGLHWSPQMAIRPDQAGSSGAFGAIPLFTGTLLISAVAMLVAVPIGLTSAIYLSEYASRRLRAVAKPLLEILAGVPTVVYGFFAAITMAPILRDLGNLFDAGVSPQSALAAGLVMGIMIIPFVSSLSDDVINAVPQTMREGALGLGATHSEMVKRVIFPAALPGIVGAILLAVSRAIGETMIVVMAAGLAANLTANPLNAVTTVTVQIVGLLTGDQAFDSPKTLAAFALGLTLFIATLGLNFIALHVVRRYREQYE